MRVNVQRVWAHVPLSAQLALLWERFTLSKLTTFYFVFSLLHFAVQLGLQSEAFVINAYAASFLGALVSQGNATQKGFTVWDGALRMCDTAPSSMSAESCEILWQPASNTGNNTVDLMNSNVTSTTSGSIASTAVSVSAALAATNSTHLPSTTTSNSVSLSSSTAALNATTSASARRASSSVAHISTITLTASTRVTAPGSTSSTAQTFTITRTPTPSVTAVTSVDHQEDEEEEEEELEELEEEQEEEDDDVHHRRRSITTESITVNGQRELRFSGSGFSDETLSYTCLTVLNWPVSQLDNTKREDITFIMFQFWLLAMSLVALLNESIPHIIATLLMHVAATAWGSFQIFDTAQFHSDFSQLTTNGACHANLLPTYWKERSDVEIPSLVLNGIALIVSGVLSWRLVKSFGWQTFKRVGASRTINHIYNVVLLLSISIQVALFFIAVTAGLWIDQLINGYIGSHTQHATAFKVVDIVVLAILVPWLSMGWIAVRREARLPMLAFLVLAIVYLAGWGSMFAAATFRWTFVQWRFFSIMASASVLLAAVTFALGVVCRINFGKGLPRYLNAEQPLPDDGEDFLPTAVDSKAGDFEKVEFPSTNTSVPTYMGFDEAEPPARAMGPRFFNPSLQPFERQAADAPPAYGAPYGNGSPMSSQTVVGETHSLKRTPTNSSNASSGSDNSTRSKRWVIE